MRKNFIKFGLQKKKAFVVGGSGLLGKEIVKLLLENYAIVINLDLNDKKSPIKKKKFKELFFSEIKCCWYRKFR